MGKNRDMAFDVYDAINLRLNLLGLPLSDDAEGSDSAKLVAPILARQREFARRLHDRLCAADLRVQNFLDDYLSDVETNPQLPPSTLILDQPGLARGLSLPIEGDVFTNELVSSYRIANGVLHNPASDRRTTAGVFHIAEGGLAIPEDKVAVPKAVYARLLELAFQPPHEMMVLPFTAHEEDPAAAFVSLLMRPIVVPAVPGFTRQRSMEIRFFAPGGLVSNLDFVEEIFGNAGDPYLPENDSSLDPIGWTGHTGCVILAPHLVHFTKKDLGLPHISQATERQIRDGQCWESEDELYNNGHAFKVCARDERGVMVTVIADNYFGYCKKEVKTQISCSANLLGGAEEEHSGGAQVYPSSNLGQEFTDHHTPEDFTIQSILDRDPERFQLVEPGFLQDLVHPNHLIVPSGSHFSLRTSTVEWSDPAGQTASIKLLASNTYFLPNGFYVQAVPWKSDPKRWGLAGVNPISTHCHKPSTVSGGGKSEISKSLAAAFKFGNAFTKDIDSDLDVVQRLLDRDYSNRFVIETENGKDHRPILSDARSLGSVIKLFTPREEYNQQHLAFLTTIPSNVKALLFMLKRHYRPEWGTDWRSHFSVGAINGLPGNNVMLDGQPVMVNMLRVGFEQDGSWRLFSLRDDFRPSVKVQTQDDITSSTVAPTDGLSRKYVINAEQMLFQRPDDAVHRGYDAQAEADIAGPDTFLSNFEPRTSRDAEEMIEDAIGFSQYTAPMQDLIRRVATSEDGYFVASDQARLVNGKPSKNPRYLQRRPDKADVEGTARADLTNHLYHQLSMREPLPLPVDVVAAGRRNNPPDDGVPPLCAYNPLHYMELPELFMEFISSMTGKSPSTTGAGSEGALTKGPFNALPTAFDLNSNFLAYALSGYDGWLSSAGYIGPNVRVDHDFSLLVPELFSHMRPAERDAKWLIANDYLDQVSDFTYEGRVYEASRLGYRMNDKFAAEYFGRIFLHPNTVFTPEMLEPELQDRRVFAESVDVIVDTHRRVAQSYFDDGTASLACPPIKALLEIMAFGQSAEGWKLHSPEFRELFTRENVLSSDWYSQRLDLKQAREIEHAKASIATLEEYTSNSENRRVSERLGLQERLERAERRLAKVSTPEFRESLVGTIGRQVSFR